ncbi:MAG TPA: GNAT family N-acetyltransferase [Ohtaekwangia sp.]|nr:GNAT family N-acetyltransferase [Ohtaekwangia sp.]
MAEESDLDWILKLFQDCILTVCREDYSQAQLIAWTSAAANMRRWKDKIQSQYFIVAHINKKLVGFGALENKNVIDLLYVHKNCQRAGVGSKLFEHLVSTAQRQGIDVLKAQVSKTARPFFESKGFAIVHEQSKQIDATALQNYQMEKRFD